jgi:hypothetical protein
MQFFCDKKIEENAIINHFRQFTNIAVASLEYPDTVAELFLICNEYTGNYPIGIAIGFPGNWNNYVNKEGFCISLAKQYNCTVLLDLEDQEGKYLLIKLTGEFKKVTIEIKGEHLLILT